MRKIFCTALILTLSLIAASPAYAEEIEATPSAVASPSGEQNVATAEADMQEVEHALPVDKKMQLIQAYKEKHPELFARLERHINHHYPTVEGERVLPIPYLTLPFRKSDIPDHYDVTEGWIYSQAEQAIHGFVDHNGIDFALPYGTPVVAPADGYAVSSFHTFWIRDENGAIKTYQDKPLRFGLGYFVQMYIPSANRYIQMAHMSDIDPAIPFSLPVESEGDWIPTNHTLAIPDLNNNPQVVYVQKGQVLGKVGYSGLAWGYEDYASGSARPVQIDPNTHKSWDEPHIHFEDFWRDQITGQKMANRDPYGIYSTNLDYPTQDRKGQPMLAPLFLRGHHFYLPRFADR